MKHLLIVEDDPKVVETLRTCLKTEKYQLTIAGTLKQARLALEENKIDGVLLDAQLPDGDGMHLCADIRRAQPTLPILMVTGRTEEESAVRGLGMGATDYIRKPFGAQELLARLRNALKQRKETSYHGLSMNLDKREASYKGEVIGLRRREFDVLRLLVENAETVMSREQLLGDLDRDAELSDRTVDSHLSRLRTKINKVAGGELFIVSVYGVGYKLSTSEK